MIKNTKGDYTVVIDGANFIRDNAEFPFAPEKLHQVLRFIEKRGGRPVALLSKTTYPKMKKELKELDILLMKLLNLKIQLVEC